MSTDLTSLFHAARERMPVPPFPSEALRSAVLERREPSASKRNWLGAIVAGASILAFGAAAEIATQSHIGFTPSGGMVLSSTGHMGSRSISSEKEIESAASQMTFKVILPMGLPTGSRPIRLFTSGRDVMAITYDLPGTWRRSHHLAWVFLANPGTLGGITSHATRYQLRPDGRMSKAQWRVGGEQVIVVSNGLTPGEVHTMQRSMQQEVR